MRRLEFIAGLGSAAAWPVVAWAQQGDRVRRFLRVRFTPARLSTRCSCNLGEDHYENR